MKTLMVFAVAVGLLVVAVEGLDPFVAWNLLPIIPVLVSAVLAHWTARSGGWVRRIIASSGGAALAVLAPAHLAWHFDWGKTATGSSTSAIMFVWLPVWAVTVLTFVAAVGLVAWALFGRRTHAAQQRDAPVGRAHD